jgi:hypothetical protein
MFAYHKSFCLRRKSHAFEVITGNRPAMDFKLFSAACGHLLGQQVACELTSHV